MTACKLCKHRKWIVMMDVGGDWCVHTDVKDTAYMKYNKDADVFDYASGTIKHRQRRVPCSEKNTGNCVDFEQLEKPMGWWQHLIEAQG